MATVTLPYGYPAIQGASYSTIVYQGTVARLYSNATDPRTDSQLFERNLLADVKRMIGSAGTWAKASWKITFGTRWSSVIYQLLKGDVSSYWSESLDLFDAQSGSWQDDWREAAPYQATFNDPGRIFFAMADMLYRWDDDRGGHRFYQPDPAGDEAVDCVAWWISELGDYGWQIAPALGEYILSQDLRWVYVGTWSLVGGKMESSTPGDYAEIIVVNSTVQFLFLGGTDGANLEIKMNGSQIGFANTNVGSPGTVYWNDVWRYVSQRTYRVVHAGSAGQKFRNDRLLVSVRYKKIDVDQLIGTWEEYSSGGSWGSEKWKSTGSGTRAIEFNFVGPYLYGFFDRGSPYGQIRVIIDDVEHAIVDLGYVDEDTISYALFGRFRNGLHHCRIEAVTAAQINFWWFVIVKGKKETVFG